MLPLFLAIAVAQTAPAVSQSSPATYPESARQDGVHGTVVLRLEVDATGAVTDASVLRPVHPTLDAAALTAGRKLRFSPATNIDGQPTPATLDYRYAFDLGQNERGGIPRPATIHGTVADSNGIALPGATITLRRADGSGSAVVKTSDAHGRFDATFLPPGLWSLQVGLDGFEMGVFELPLTPGETLDSVFRIAPENELLVVVYATRNTWREVDRGALVADETTTTGFYELTRRDIESTPGALEDITRAAHALPGVVSDGDILAGFHVRGGEQSDVVYLLDRVPLENPFHLAGFNSLFNPDMIERVGFYAGAAPAEVPSGTSAVMDVHSWDGSPKEPGGGFDGAIDLSASSARVSLVGPLDPDERFTIALAARRTYLEGYMQVLKWVNVLDTAFAAPEFSELSARAAWRPNTRHRVLVSALRSGDSLALIDSDDDSLVNFSGAFELRNSLTLFSADHRYTHPRGGSFQTTVAHTQDRSYQRRDLAGSLERDTRFGRTFLRSDGVLPFGEHATIKLGGDVSQFRLDATGELEDNRSVPTWTQAGIADFGLPLADVDNTPAPWTEANGYAQVEIEAPLGEPVQRGSRSLQPAIRVRAGLRSQLAGLTGEFLHSPRAGIAIPLPTGTIPKASIGLYQRVIRDPVLLAPGYGNPELHAERARHLVIGLDQAFPLPGEGTGGLIRVETYRIDLEDLVVRPDTPEAVATATAFQNVGSGRNQGLDVMVAARSGRWNAQLAYGLLFATRDNPLLTRFPTTVAPPQDQRHTLSMSGDLQVSPHWRLTSRYTYHSGRPVSRVAVDGEVLTLVGLNDRRMGPTHQIDLRAEWRRAYKKYRLSFYVELLNIGNIQSDFLPIHDIIDGELSTTKLRHLPMRPFLGLRADF